jgi:prepilin-type N-terminal cleavage/methylation domain-containing protein
MSATNRISDKISRKERHGHATSVSGASRRGFTLIELCIVLVVIGVLASIAIPNYVLMTTRAKDSKVKENCHCLQLGSGGLCSG